MEVNNSMNGQLFIVGLIVLLIGVTLLLLGVGGKVSAETEFGTFSGVVGAVLAVMGATMMGLSAIVF